VSKNVLYEVTTKMEKEDYRKFSYLTIFRRKYVTILLIALLAAIGSAFAVFADGDFKIIKFLLIWFILILTAFVAIFLRVEYKNLKRQNLNLAGMSNQKQIITFYENYLTAANENVKKFNKIKYDNLYQVFESKDYYIVYSTQNSASLIRKKDIDVEYRDEIYEFITRKLGKRFKKI